MTLNELKSVVMDAAQSLTYAYDGIELNDVEKWFDNAAEETIQHSLMGPIQDALLTAMGLRRNDDEGTIVTIELTGDVDTEAAICAISCGLENMQEDGDGEFEFAICTSDDPTNHQGDTCPVHEA
jgi:hypothetical protein